MPLDVPAVQRALVEDGLDAWLLYDFHGSNPIASRLTGLNETHAMASRRWYYLIPRTGSPRGLVHAIERHNLDGVPGPKTLYANRETLQQGLRHLLDGCHVVAMEFSPRCAIPYISRVDGGTVDLIRSLGVDVVSSGDLVQRFEARWSDAAIEAHREASKALYRIKDRAFEAVSSALRQGAAVTELDIQNQMVTWFDEEGLVTDSPPIVAAQENAGNPHYLPTPDAHRPIRRDEVVLLDLWGKKDQPGAVYADITWVGFTGASAPSEVSNAFAAIRGGRDAAVTLVQDRAASGVEVRGWEVDRAARQVIEQAGYADYILHRTGHSLGESVHGNGVHMDDYETHDDRRLLPGTGFTIEPGLYFPNFGVRTEINVCFGDRRADVTGPAQADIVTLA
jgi:Xaa-Pro dipeptidase